MILAGETDSKNGASGGLLGVGRESSTGPIADEFTAHKQRGEAHWLPLWRSRSRLLLFLRSYCYVFEKALLVPVVNI